MHWLLWLGVLAGFIYLGERIDRLDRREKEVERRLSNMERELDT